MNAEVGVYTASGVRTVTISVPQRRNALSRAVLGQLRAAMTEPSEPPDVSAIVLTGADGVFSAGADFAELTGTAADESFDDEVAETVAAIRAAAVPVLAAIEGPCVGAAVDLALACDVRVCAEDGWLRLPAVRLGLLYNPAAIARMYRILPRDTVARLVLLAERFTAESAQQAGLVSTVAPSGTALEHAHTIVTDLQSAPRDALSQSKRLLAALDDGAIDEAYWQGARESLLKSPSRHEAVRARRDRHAAAR